MGRRIGDERTFWRSLWRAGPVATVLAPVLVIATALGAWLTMSATGHVVSAAVERDESVWRWLVLALVGMVGQPVATAALEAVAARHQAAVTERRHRLLAEAAVSPHGIAHLETAQTAGELAAVAEHVRSAKGLDEIPAVWRVLSARASGVASFAVVAAWSWWAAFALVVMFQLNGIPFARYLDVVTDEMFTEQSVPRRRSRYLLGWLLGRDTAKEVRLFGLTPWTLRAYASVWEDTMQCTVARRRQALRIALWAGLALSLGLGCVMGWLVHDAWVGAISVGIVVSVAQAIDGTSAFGPLGDDTVDAARARATEVRIVALAKIGRDSAAPKGVGSSPTVETVGSTSGHGAAPVDLADVTFTYPSRSEPTLRGLDLHIPAGQSVAVVGVNGVGKSTLIKLLCGLYSPDTGTVRVAGGDPGADDGVRRRVAVIFQDFVRYQLSLRENIAMGAAGEVDRALADAAGADVLARVSGDWDTVLDPGYAGGTDLSGGQWQRVALARALTAVRRGAGVLVLDEPTASLDVRAEAAIFDRFLEMTQGVTTILVSHRLSSVRHAERIVVLGPDGIVQDGSHAELLASGGEYSTMFRLQAARFAAAGDLS